MRLAKNKEEPTQASVHEDKKPKAGSSVNVKRPNGKNQLQDLLKNGKTSKFTLKLSPMLATLVDKPFDEPGWSYEVKWDGYRALAFMNKGKAELKSRNDKSFNDKFYPVLNAVLKWGINAIVDGEIVVATSEGISHFGNLQNWRSEADGELLFYVFDLLWYDGKDLTQLPLIQRREILRHLVPASGIIRMSETFSGSGMEFFEAAKAIGLEGIMAKKDDSLYSPGIRTKEWLKVKINKRQEMVIGGYTINDGTSKAFSALLVGVFEKGRLVYTGKIGTGFSDKTQKEMLKLFKPLVINESPFTEPPDINKPSRFRPNPPHATAVFLKPELVCEVSFAEMTSDGVMRHPSFEGMRTDKPAKTVKRETEAPVGKILKSNSLSTKKLIRPTEGGGRKTLLNPTDETQVRSIGGHELKFTNLSKIYWPKEKVSKRDMLNYYYQVAPFILPYLKDRPQSLNRHPNGINGKSFYQKDVTGKAPEWIDTFLYHSDFDNRDKHFLVAGDEASLLYMASLGCIEMNPWSSRKQSPDHPDWCVIDLDPGNKTFNQVIEAANITKTILDDLGIASYCKTSGSRGLHIYIPLGAKYTYEQSKEFARVIATLVHNEIPKFTSIERVVRERDGKMYIDFLQNRPQATIASAYSLRPKPGATVSMPLHWEEVRKGLKMTDFTIFNAPDRVRNEGDIFKPVLGKGIQLEKIVRNFTK
jgi:bifunctional non-homologous end joining protein LigD